MSVTDICAVCSADTLVNGFRLRYGLTRWRKIGKYRTVRKTTSRHPTIQTEPPSGWAGRSRPWTFHARVPCVLVPDSRLGAWGRGRSPRWPCSEAVPPPVSSQGGTRPASHAGQGHRAAGFFPRIRADGRACGVQLTEDRVLLWATRSQAGPSCAPWRAGVTGRGAQLQPGAPPAPSPCGSPRPGSGRGRDIGPHDQAGAALLCVPSAWVPTSAPVSRGAWHLGH